MILPSKLQNKTWTTSDEGVVTSADLQAVLTLLAANKPHGSHFPGGASSRRADRAIQTLKSAGLVTYDKGLRRFVLVSP